VNRVVNCETANLNKVVKAAVQQVACIKYLQKQPGYSQLSNALQETAELRLKHPDVSLSELVEFTEGTVGKSGLNHRLKKLQALAKSWGMPVMEE
jgi:DNA-binding protein WhiA